MKVLREVFRCLCVCCFLPFWIDHFSFTFNFWFVILGYPFRCFNPFSLPTTAVCYSFLDLLLCVMRKSLNLINHLIIPCVLHNGLYNGLCFWNSNQCPLTNLISQNGSWFSFFTFSINNKKTVEATTLYSNQKLDSIL